MVCIAGLFVNGAGDLWAAEVDREGGLTGCKTLALVRIYGCFHLVSRTNARVLALNASDHTFNPTYAIR